MSDMTAAMDTALGGANPVLFGLVRIDLPAYTLRLIDGAVEISWDSGTWVGRDATFGALAGIDGLGDGFGDEVPEVKLVLHPPSDAAAASLSAATFQGSRVRVWLGAVSAAAVVADPYLLFDGFVDQPTLRVDRGKREVEYRCVSAMERLFDDDEGFRLSDANHKRVWSGEEGLEHMSGLVKKIYWGVAAPSGAAPGSPGGGSRGFDGQEYQN